jgi:hypothetical protein
MSTFVAVAAAVISLISLFVSAYALGESKKTRDMQHFYYIFKDIMALEGNLKTYIDRGEKEIWLNLFFGTLEYFSFLRNQKLLPEKPVEYFKDAIIEWYEGVFMVHMPKEKQENPMAYPEFKALYKKIKGQNRS